MKKKKSEIIKNVDDVLKSVKYGTKRKKSKKKSGLRDFVKEMTP